MHAYLILANKNLKQLQELIAVLDNEQNDIYLFIDKKSQMVNNLDTLSTNVSKLFVFHDVSVYWGDYSIVQAELEMLKRAIAREYDYYHIISGVDLPLQTQSYIHKFFDRNPGKIFISLSGEISQSEIRRRSMNHIFRRHLRRENKAGWKMMHQIQRAWLVPQIIFSKLHLNNFEYVGSNWSSFDHEFAKILVDSEDEIFDRYSKGYIVDEVFIPWVIDKNNLWSKVYNTSLMRNNENSFQANLRYINWWSGSDGPKIFKTNDLKELEVARQKGYLFARKFDQDTDEQIITNVINLFAK